MGQKALLMLGLSKVDQYKYYNDKHSAMQDMDNSIFKEQAATAEKECVENMENLHMEMSEIANVCVDFKTSPMFTELGLEVISAVFKAAGC